MTARTILNNYSRREHFWNKFQIPIVMSIDLPVDMSDSIPLFRPLDPLPDCAFNPLLYLPGGRDFICKGRIHFFRILHRNYGFFTATDLDAADTMENELAVICNRIFLPFSANLCQIWVSIS